MLPKIPWVLAAALLCPIAFGQSVAKLQSIGGADVRVVIPLGIDAPADAVAAFRVVAHMPYGVTEELAKSERELRMHVGAELVPNIDAPSMPAGHPRSALSVPMGALFPPSMAHLRLQRGANRMVSAVIIAIADPRASIHYAWPAGADKRAAGCYRCDRPAQLAGKTETDGVYELFTNGRHIIVRPEANVFADTTYAFYGVKGRLEARVATLMADTIRPPTVRVAANAPPVAGGLLAERTYLHSGELESRAVDLDAGGRAGWNIAMTRTYRSRTIGWSPLGAGWDSPMFARLRSLPNGDVEYRDGAETWHFRATDGGQYTSPAGLFLRLTRTGRGWTIVDRRGRITTFDDLGRMVTESDEFFDPAKPGSGNTLTYLYGADSRLSKIIDPVGRVTSLHWEGMTGLLREVRDWRARRVVYGHDGQRRLIAVDLPATDDAAPRVAYAYGDSAASLNGLLDDGNNLTNIRDPNEVLGGGAARVTFVFENDRVTGQHWATGEGASFTYEPNSVIVRDVLGQERRYALTAADTENLLADRVHVANVRETAVSVWSGAPFGSLPATTLAGVPTTTASDRVSHFTYDNGVATSLRLDGVAETTIAHEAAEGAAPGLRVQSSTTKPLGGGGGGGASFLPAAGPITRSFEYQSGSNFLDAIAAGGKKIAATEPHRANTKPVTKNNEVTTKRTFDSQGRPVEAASSGGTDAASAGAKGSIEYYGDGGALHVRGLPRIIREGEGDDELATTIEYPSVTETKTTDARGVVTTTTRDAWDRPVRLRVERPGDPLVLEQTFGYDATGRLVRTTEKKGEGEILTTYAYDVMGRRTSATTNGIASVGSVTTTTEYDLPSRKIVTTHPGGAVTTTELDPLGRVMRRVTETGSSPIEERFAYDLAGNPVYATDMFTASATAFDAHGRAVAARAADGTLATTEYDEWSRPKTMRSLSDDASSVIAETSLARTDAGRVTSIATKIDDGVTRTTGFAWDGGGRTTRRATNGRASSSTFDIAGRMRGHAAGAGDLEALSEIFERTELPAHDGHLPVVTKSTERSGATYTATMGHDTSGGVTRESVGPLEWKRGFDELGNVTEASLPRRPPTLWQVDARGAIESETLADGAVNAYAYDASGASTGYTDPATEATSTITDRIGRPIRHTYPDGTTEEIEWEGPRVKSVTDRQARKQSFVYNAKGQLVEVRGGDEETIERLAYDGAARLVSWKNADAEIVWSTFDLDGNPKHTVQRRFRDGTGLSTSPEVLDEHVQEHRWNEHGERVKFSMPGGAQWVRQRYDAMGNITEIARLADEGDDTGTIVMTASHRGAGRPDVRTVFTQGAPIVRAYAYDVASSLLSRVEVIVNGVTVAGSEAQHDGLQTASARMLGISSGERSSFFRYDARSRLAASQWGARGPAAPASEVLTAADFRTAHARKPLLPASAPGASAVDPPSSSFEEQTGHKIARATRGPLVLPFGYAGAERIDDGRFVYVFDAKGRLLRATEKASVLPLRRAVYSYSGTGRLVGRRAEYATAPDEWKLEDRPEVLAADGLPSETTFVWDAISDRLIGVSRAGTTTGPLKQIIHGDAAYDDPLVTISTAGILYPIYDEAASGSLQAVLNASGEVVARNLGNDPYGAHDVALTGPAVDRVEIAATKNAAGAIERVDVTLHATEPLDPATLPDGARLAAVRADGSVVRLAATAPLLVEDDPFSIRWTFDAAEWAALSADGDALSVAATRALRATTWPAGTPLMPAPEWARATQPVFASESIPFELREPLAPLASTLSGIPTAVTRSFPLWEVPTLALLGVSPSDTPLDDILTARFHAHPLTEPLTGLNYVRARWYDPSSGSFLSPDPKGYIDSANLYAFAGGDPVNGRDPRGEAASLGKSGWIVATQRNGGLRQISPQEIAADPAAIRTFLMTESGLYWREAYDLVERAGYAERPTELLNAVARGTQMAKKVVDAAGTALTVMSSFTGVGGIAQATQAIVDDGATKTNVALAGLSVIGLGATDDIVRLGNLTDDASRSAARFVVGPDGVVAETAPLPGPGEDLFVGTYRESSKANRRAGTNTTYTPHHAIADVISPVPTAEGITINLQKRLHELTRTYKRNPVRGQAFDEAAQLHEDVENLRRILLNDGYPLDQVERALNELVRQNMTRYLLGQ